MFYNTKLNLSFFSLSRQKQQDLINLLGATYSAVLFLGATNTSAVQSVIAIERTVFYRERAAGMYSELPYAFAQVRNKSIYQYFMSHFFLCMTNVYAYVVQFR